MKVKFEEKETKCRIPEVSEVWRHEDSSYIYMRINDNHGKMALGREEEDGIFYSISFANFEVYSTSRNSKDIEILTPDRVEDETVIFVKKE